jgi:hypothetical protein
VPFAGLAFGTMQWKFLPRAVWKCSGLLVETITPVWDAGWFLA